MKKVVHFGAGNIGRGFIGQVLAHDGWQVIFVDIVPSLVDEINARRKYHVEIVGEKSETLLVENVSAIDSTHHQDLLNDAITRANLITTAVGANVLKFVAPNIAKGLIERFKSNENPLNIIACENMIASSSTLKKLVLENLPSDLHEKVEDLIGFPDAAVDRIVPNQIKSEPLIVQVERFSEWDVDALKTLGHEISDVEGLLLVKNLPAYVERKLFTINTGHAAIAYLAYLKGIRFIRDAMKDPEIVEMARKVWYETSELLIEKHGFSREEMHEYVAITERRFANPYLTDEVLRVGGSPIRKLGAKDRLTNPATQLIERGKSPDAIAKIIAAAFRFDPPEDREAVEIQKFIRENGIDSAITKFTGIERDSKLFTMIKSNF